MVTEKLAVHNKGGTLDVLTTDFNGAAALIGNHTQTEWTEIETILSAMPLYFKGSDQEGKQGTPIFDPVATNKHISDGLFESFQWERGVKIPSALSFFGTGVDLVKNGIVTEVQFSNYPFLSNNTCRTEVFHRKQVPFGGKAVQLFIIITKVGKFPASNSTLYYEQAQKQLAALVGEGIIKIPIRLVGLSTITGSDVRGMLTKYPGRTGRQTVYQQEHSFRITGTGPWVIKDNGAVSPVVVAEVVDVPDPALGLDED